MAIEEIKEVTAEEATEVVTEAVTEEAIGPGTVETEVASRKNKAQHLRAKAVLALISRLMCKQANESEHRKPIFVISQMISAKRSRLLELIIADYIMKLKNNKVVYLFN